MDLLQRAARRYAELDEIGLPVRDRRRNAVGLEPEKLLPWIQDGVVPAVESIWENEHFRELATWSLRHLPRGSTGGYRKLIGSVHQSLVDWSRSLLEIAERAAVVRGLKEAYPPKPMAVKEEVWLGTMPAGKMIRPTRSRNVDEIGLLISQAKLIANHDQSELAFAQDYFGPMVGLLGATRRSVSQKGKARSRRQSIERVTDAALMPFINLHLPPLGDFVSRCARIRIESFDSILKDLWQRIKSAVVRPSAALKRGLSRAESAGNQLYEHYAHFRAMIEHGASASWRQAATILTQVFIAFRPKSDVKWLDLDDGTISHGKNRIREVLEYRISRQEADLIATALGTIRPLMITSPSDRREIDAAIRNCRLVICEDPPLIYWDQKEVAFDAKRHRGPWRFMVALMKQSYHGRSLTKTSYGKDSIRSDKHRATALLAKTLNQLIIIGEVEGSYRINLPPDQMHFFDSLR